MKRREFSVAALTTCTFGPSAYAQANKKPEEGIEYVSLDKRVPTEVGDGKVEVLEFFWYSCPHCNLFEPRFASWIKSVSKDVVVKRVPVRFREDFEAMHGKLFNAIHNEKQNLTSGNALAAWAGKNGLAEQKFLETFNSFGVSTKARRATQLQEAFKVQGVPALGVAGRFYTDGSLAGTMERALQITDYLIGEVRRGR
jgi:thiol:disulfide interchange protein DsbA